MPFAYSTRSISLVLVLLVSLDGCHTWLGLEKDKNLLMTLCNDLVVDLSRKGETVWPYRKVYAQYVSFAVGERVYLVRARYAAMLRAYMRNQMRRSSYDVNQLVRNALMLQKRTQGIYILNDELVQLDLTLSTVDNPYNMTRFGPHGCHVAGPPCNIIPVQQGYRRSGAMEEALKLLETRRNFIRKKYLPKKILPPIDIGAEINRSFNYKYTKSSTPQNRDMNTEFVNLAPDFMN